MSKIFITPSLNVDKSEIRISFTRGSGPGGQNVNKRETAVHLYFNVKKSPSLPPEIKNRLLKLAGGQISSEGILVIKANTFRTQHRNREEALNRFALLLRKAAIKRKTRRKTKPSAAVRTRILEKKRRRSQLKKQRKPVKTE